MGRHKRSCSRSGQVRKASSVLSVINQPIGGSMAMDENPDFILSIQAKASNGGDLSYQWYKAATNSAAAMTCPEASSVVSLLCPPPLPETVATAANPPRRHQASR